MRRDWFRRPLEPATGKKTMFQVSSIFARVTQSVLLALAALLIGPHAGAAERPPNILFILADDHRPDALGALGNPVVKTPNLDTLVERGMTFSHCYVMGSMS